MSLLENPLRGSCLLYIFIPRINPGLCTDNSYGVKKLFVLVIISIIKSAFLLVAIYFCLLPFLPFFYLVTSNCFSPKAICFVRVLMTSRRKRSILTRYEHIKYMNQSRTFYFHVPVPIKELCKSSLCITPGFIRGKEWRQ